MYNISKDNIKYFKRFYLKLIILSFSVFIILSTILVTIGKENYQTNKTAKIIDTKQEVKESLSADDKKYIYYYHYYYEVNGKAHTCTKRNDTILNIVFYNQKDPSKCMILHEKVGFYAFHIGLLAILVFMILSIKQLHKARKSQRNIKILQKKGKLIKSIPCTMKNTGLTINGQPYHMPVVSYQLKTGNIIDLYGLERHDPYGKYDRKTVDLLIDEDNPKIYYIDYRIDRISGNLDQDYYLGKKDSSEVPKEVEEIMKSLIK